MSDEKPLTRIDCSLDYPPEKYFDTGDVRIVSTSAGTYREAGAKPLSRFGYRFTIRNVGQPHVAVIIYPDDRRRFMCIVDGTSYDLSTAVTTDFAHPTSGRMIELRQIFWPRWRDCSITFMTWGHDEPAAVASIEVRELTDIPPLAVPHEPGRGEGRVLGIQYEDPCGTGASEGATSREEWAQRVIAYARHTGRNLLSYPIVWYHGPRFPSDREPSDDFDMVVAPDRRQYARWTAHPHDWVADLLARLGDNGMMFQGVLTLLRLGSLMRRMNTDLDAIRAGADTINSMLSCDDVQSGTMDWTPPYNVRNFPGLVGTGHSVGVAGNFGYAYGEKTGQPYRPGPIFNALHPVVQEAVVEFVREIGGRYGQYDAFKGIAVTMWAPTIIWFGSIHSGYDDYTVSLFERETGIRVPVDAAAHDRFSLRYRFLTHGCRRVWIDWRCRKVRELVLRMRDALQSGRSDLRLTLNLWSEPFVPAVIGNGGPEHQLHARPSNLELFREAGIDPQLYRDDDGIDLDLQLDGGERDRTRGNEPDAPLEAFTMFRDHDYLDHETHDAIRVQKRPGIYIFNAWHEAWGDHRWFPCEPDDDQARRLAVMSGEPADGIFRMNSSYPPDGFWWNSQLRITPAFPAAPHFMEPYAHAVAEFDALRITRGGLFLDKAHTEEVRHFALAYRALPPVRFATVGERSDPVAVREAVYGNRRYWYAVNREYYDVAIDVTSGGSDGPVIDLATGAPVEFPSADRRLTLGPYELRSFSCDPRMEIVAFDVEMPSEMVRRFEEDAARVIEAFEACRGRGEFVAGLAEAEAELRSALASKCYARTRRLLTSYAARKALALTGDVR